MSAPNMTPAMLDDLLELEARIDAKLDEECPAEFVVKEDDLPMQAAAWGLDRVRDLKAAARMISSFTGLKDPLAAISAVDGTTFMNSYVTTYGNRISAPRALHAPEAVARRIPLKGHERQHVRQHMQRVKDSGWPEVTSHSVLYLAGVLLGTEDGVIYVGKVEGDSYAVGSALELFLTGSAPEEGAIVGQLRAHYNLGGIGPEAAEGTLRTHYRTMKAGGTPNVWAARVALDVMRTHGKALQGRVVLA